MKRTMLALICALTALTATAGPKIGPGDLKDCKMEYPRASLMNEETGTVTVDIQVDGDGKVVDAKVITSSGHKSLDTGTLNQVRKCKIAKASGPYSIEYVWSLS
jgi:protein TonB